MTATVVQGRGNLSSSTVSLLAGTIVAGDWLALVIADNGATAANVTAVTGCGATWSPAYVGPLGRFVVWIGLNPTSLGAITATRSIGSLVGFTAFQVRDVSPVVAAGNEQHSASGAGTLTTTAATVSPGQVVLSRAFNPSGSTYPSPGSLPTVGDWTLVSGHAAAYAAPSVAGSYQTKSTQTGTSRHVLGQIVLGAAAAEPPTALTQTGATTSTVTVGWTAPASGATPTSYEVRVDGGPAVVDVGLVTSRTVTGLAAGTTHTVEVRTVAGGSRSGWVLVNATTTAPPNPPTALTQTAATATSVTVGWTPPATGPAPTSYELRVNGGAPLDVALATTHTIEGLLPSTTYTVEVRSVTTVTSGWVALDVTTNPPSTYRPWLVSETLLARAGLDPRDDQPAFQWHVPGGDAYELHATRSRALMGWTITTGRSGPRDKVPPTIATITLAAWGDYAAALPELGHRFRLALSPALTVLGIAEADLPRFTGEVTDVSLDTRTEVLTVTAVGRYARGGRLTVDPAGWPVEREGARMARIIEGMLLDAGTVDPGRVELLPNPAAAAAQQLVDAVSDSTTGQLVERRDGRLDWHDADHRRDAVPALTLDASELLAGFTWSQRVGDLTNSVTVRYGAGEQTVVDDAFSVDVRGAYPATLDTLLPLRAHAQAIAGLIVGRYGRPVWLLPAVMVDLMRTLPAADLGTGLALAHGTMLQLSDLPAGGPYTARGVFVEGVTETLTPRAWRLALTVADEQLAGAPIRWRDVPDGVRWTDVRDDLRWLDVATLTDPADLT